MRLFLVHVILLSKVVYGQDEEKKTRIRNFVENARQCRRNPGLMLAIVKDDEVFMTEGFGQKDLSADIQEPSNQVTANTRFAIASCGKLHTTTLMAKLWEEHAANPRHNLTINWYTKLVDVMELTGDDFDMPTDLLTEQVNLRDVVSHKTGIPYYNFWEYGHEPGLTRDEFCRRMYNLQTTYDYREYHSYSDMSYTMGACAAEITGGDSYANMIRQKLYNPLGMNSTMFPATDQDWSQDFARHYVWYNGRHEPLDMKLVENSFPGEASGGHWSTANDMATWMRFMLNRGTFGGQRLLSDDAFDNIFYEEFSNEDYEYRPPQYPYDEFASTYGLGAYLGSYRGYRRFSHAGEWFGYESFQTYYPEMNIGIFTAVSGPMYHDGYYIAKALHAYLSDEMLDLPVWLNESTVCTFPRPWGSPNFTAMVHKDRKPRMVKTIKLEYSEEPEKVDVPELFWFRPYVGDYGHLMFGNFTVHHNATDDTLRFYTGRHAEGILMPDNPPQFRIRFTGMLWHKYITHPENVRPDRVVFRDPVLNEYQELLNYAIQDERPPLFVRGLQWDDEARPRFNYEDF